MDLKPLPLAGVINPGKDPYLAYLECTAHWLECARFNPWIDGLSIHLRSEPLHPDRAAYINLDFTLFYGHDDYARRKIARRFNGIK